MSFRDPDTPDIFTGQLPAEMPSPSALATGDLNALVTTIPQQEIVIDWARFLKLRPWVLQHDPELSYLLLPEMTQLIESARTEQMRVLFATLWVTGGRISEVLAMTPAHCINDDHLGQGIALPTLKKRNGQPYRLVPVVDPHYWAMLKRFLGEHRGGQHAPIFQSRTKTTDAKRAKPKALTSRTVQRWTDDAMERLREHYNPGLRVTPHTFRHSFAVNALLHGRDIQVISGWLGHASVRETERYLKVLSLDTGHLMQGVQYFI
ncbi:tyrosine-type recombinase/integrase [Reinekea blandensis]|uniref:Resolvase n=1 Tax=Reinekea blandensis MED297 TaxID=314283 RepID=A4BJY9_9GAMM|nr:site-specific integrase [Reinekea blandensis]EAR07590.1 resolvase [Reinekea sp. MED297] [Reinekea blandensis MED297]